MKNIKFPVFCLFVVCCVLSACSGGVSSVTPMQDAMKGNNYPTVNVPKNIQHAKPDAQFSDEKAIVVSVPYGRESRLFVGKEEFSREYVVAEIEIQLKKNPSAKSLIYLNADYSADYGKVVVALDLIRKNDLENVGLLVDPATPAADKKMQVLKVKIPPEPRAEDTGEEFAGRQFVILQKNGKVKLDKFENLYKPKSAAPEIAEEEVSGKLSQIFKENEAKKITLKNSGEIDKTVFVKGTRSSRYADVIRLADAALGAGASEVYLMIDDLEQ